MSELPNAAVERLLRSSGAERVSVTAVEALVTHLETEAQKIGVQATKFAKHAGRKTVTGEDITLSLAHK